MRTSEDGVVALGGCAEHRGTVYGIVAPSNGLRHRRPIYEQVKVAADPLLRPRG